MKEKIEKIGKKKIILVVTFLVLIIVILFGGAFIYNKFFYKRSYSEIENIMLEAAKNYMTKNSNNLPKNINDSVTLSVSDLVRTEEMKELDEYLKDDSVSCKGSVMITNVNQTYRYTPNLDCGTKYKTLKFIDYIKEHQPIVENGNGLYNLNEELVFRGDSVHNYLKLSGKMYRIVKFSNEEAVIIYAEKSESMVWDDRYNIDKNSIIGINDYSVSKIKEYLDNLYRGTTILGVNKTTLVDYKSLVVAYPLAIGKRSSKDTDKTGTLEKGVVMENQFIGLLPLYDYMNASLDANCTTSISASCMNYNYLAKYKYPWWVMTANSEKTYNVYRIDKSANLSSANGSAYVRHVFHLVKDALYVSGDGTYDNPYIIK